MGSNYLSRVTLLGVFLFLTLQTAPVSAFQDEFAVRGPGELHRAALDAIFEERRTSPGKKDSFSEDSTLMQKAKEYAIHRFITKPDEALQAPVSVCLSAGYPSHSIITYY